MTLIEQLNTLFKNPSLPFPTRKEEDWQYTSFEKLASFPKNNDKDSKISKKMQEKISALQNRIVFVNGVYNQELSNSSLKLKEEKKSNSFKNDYFTELNQELSAQYSLTLENKVNFISIMSAKSAIVNSSLYISVKANTKAELNEFFLNDSSDSFMNHMTQITCEQNSQLRHGRFFLTNEKNIQNDNLRVIQKRDSQIETVIIDLGGDTLRTNNCFKLEETGADTKLFGLFSLQNKEHSEHNTFIHHACEHTTSEQIYKGILDNESHGIFRGRVVVAKNAQKIASSQLNRNLLLSKKAHIHSLPQLEIFADDVKCSHGSTTGQLREDEVFYLESRGIPKEKAILMLTEAFSFEILDKIQNKEIAKIVSEYFLEKFNHIRLIK